MVLIVNNLLQKTSRSVINRKNPLKMEKRKMGKISVEKDHQREMKKETK